MSEALFLMLLSVAGFLSLERSCGRDYFLISLCAAFPLGVVFWTILSLAMSLVNMPLWLAFVMLIGIAVFNFILCAHRAKTSDRVRLLLRLIIVALLAGGLGLLLAKLGWVQVSYDSIEQIVFGRFLALRGNDEPYDSLFSTWGLVVPMIQSAGVMIGVDVIRGAQGVMWLSFSGVLGVSIWKLAERYRGLASILAVVFLASTEFVSFQSSYIHNSLPSATFLLIYASSIALALKSNDPALLEIAFLGLVGFVLCRTEAIVFAVLSICFTLPIMGKSILWNRFKMWVVLFSVFVIIWGLQWLYIIGAGSDIMTPGRICVQLITVATTCLLIFAPGRFGIQLRCKFPFIAVCLSLVCVLLAFLLDPNHVQKNAAIILQNLFQTGRWGLAWWVLIILGPFAYALGRGGIQNSFLAFVLVFFCVVLVMGSARIPYRLGWFDSANRIFTHLLPIVVFGVAIALTQKSLVFKNKQRP